MLHEEWTARITNEFWTLGERERSLNVAISPLCDRQTDVDVAKSQVGFFSFICMPFYTVVADLVDPDILPLSRLKQNLRYWQTKNTRGGGRRPRSSRGPCDGRPDVVVHTIRFCCSDPTRGVYIQVAAP